MSPGWKMARQAWGPGGGAGAVELPVAAVTANHYKWSGALVMVVAQLLSFVSLHEQVGAWWRLQGS